MENKTNKKATLVYTPDIWEAFDERGVLFDSAVTLDELMEQCTEQGYSDFFIDDTDLD